MNGLKIPAALRVARKDIKIFLKERGTLLYLFVIPLAFVLALSGAAGVGSDPQEEAITVPVVNLDAGSGASVALLDALNQGGGIQVLGLEDPESGPGLGRVQTVVDRVAELPAVKYSTRDDGHLKIEVHRFQEALMAILDITNQLDVRITSMEKWEPNLESVFLHLTGKRLRE